MGNNTSSLLSVGQGSPMPEEKKNALQSLKNSQLVVSNKAGQDLDLLKDIVSGLGKNNTELILASVDKYNTLFAKDDPNKRVVINDKIVSTIKSFHNNLIKSMNGEDIQYMNQEQRVNKLASVGDFQNATQTFAAIKKYVSEDIEKVRSNIVEDNVIAQNDEIKKTVNAIFNNFSDLKARDTFFQYKYVQSYIFLVIFVQHVYHSMQNFVKEVIMINELKDRHRQEAYRKIFQKILDMYEAKDTALPDLENIDNMNRFFQDLEKDISAKQGEVQKAFDVAQKSNMEGILRFIIENETSMKDTLINVVKDLEKTTPKPMATPAPTQPLAPTVNINIPGAPAVPTTPSTTIPTQTTQTTQQGGFVRGGSTFPQSFYKL